MAERASRWLAAAIMGLILAALASLAHAAASAGLGGGWSWLWATWLAAALVAGAVTFGAPSARQAWSRLSLVNAAAAGALLVASLVVSAPVSGLADEAAAPPWLGAAHPLGAAIGAALLSGLLGLAAAIVAACFVALFFLLHRSHRHRHL